MDLLKSLNPEDPIQSDPKGSKYNMSTADLIRIYIPVFRQILWVVWYSQFYYSSLKEHN